MGYVEGAHDNEVGLAPMAEMWKTSQPGNFPFDLHSVTTTSASISSPTLPVIKRQSGVRMRMRERKGGGRGAAERGIIS